MREGDTSALWPSSFQRLTSAVLVVLTFGFASAHGVRTCSHHPDDPTHGAAASSSEHASGPQHGPCDHFTSLCEVVGLEPQVPTASTALLPDPTIELVEDSPASETELPPDPPFLLPFSIGPPTTPA